MSSHRPWLSCLVLLGAVAVIGTWLGTNRRFQTTAPASRRSVAFAGDADGKSGAPDGDRPSSQVATDPSSETVDRIRRLLGQMEPVLPGEIENAAALELLRRWSEAEPAAAIEFASRNENLHGRGALPIELFLAWLERRPTDAMAWMKELPGGPLRSQLLPSAVAILARQQPMEALAMSAGLSGENRRAALSALFLEWSSNDPRAAAEQALALPQHSEKNSALRAVLGKWMDSDVRAAMAWAKRLPPDPAPDSFEVLPPVSGVMVEKWAASAPAEAAGYVLAMPEAAGRIGLLKTIAVQWAGTDAREALRYTSGIASETDRTVMVRGILAAMAETDMRAAADLALNPPSRLPNDDGLGFVIEQWSARDPRGLAAWATTVVQSDTVSAIDSVVRTWAAADVNSVETWVKNLGAGETRDRVCLALSEFFAARDKGRAMKWAGAISNPEVRHLSLQRLRGM